MTTCILLPTYNERENLPRLVAAIADLSLPDTEMCVIDDASPDGTGALARDLARTFPVHVIHRSEKLGLGTAYQAGFAYALASGAERIVTMDVDLSHDPRDLPRILYAAARGADVVIGSRRIPGGKIVGWGFLREIASAGAMVLARALLGIHSYDVTSGYRCYSRRALETIPLATISSSGYAFLEEILYCCERAGLRVVEVPICFVDRRAGHSKLGTREIVNFFLTLLRLRWKRKS